MNSSLIWTSPIEKKILIIIVGLSVIPQVNALPEGYEMVFGEASLSQTPHQMILNQTTDQGIFNWKKFDIAAHEQFHVQQTDINSTSLHRISTEYGASNIMGKITSNGTIFLLNPAGFVFGKDCVIDVANFIATTANITNENFINRNYTFEEIPGFSASIRNEGRITIKEGGLVGLVAPGVDNRGTIVAHSGQVHLISGTKFTVDLGQKKIQFAVDGKVKNNILNEKNEPLESAIKHTGSIYADGAKVAISAYVAEKIVDNAINIGGIIEAKSLRYQNGSIELVANDGNVQIGGQLNVSGIDPGESGGKIEIKANKISILESAQLKAQGYNGGGEINSKSKTFSFLAKNALIDVSATALGHGGSATFFSDKDLVSDATIYAEGGKQGGNGGKIETSGLNFLHSSLTGSAKAYFGLPGEWKLDPADVNIVAGVVTINGAFTGGNPNLWLPTGTPSSVGATLITTLLNAGTSVNISTTGLFAGNGDITVQSNVVTTAGAAGTTFSLLADRNITINPGITVNTQGNATFTAGLTVNTGTFTNSGTLTVSQATSITAPGGITFTPALTLAGAVSLNSSGNNGNILFSSTVNGAGNWTLNAGLGNITFASTVGATTALGGLSITGASLVNVGGNISTNNALISIPFPITLTANSTFSAGTNAVTLSTVNGAHTFTINATGATTLGGALGGTTPLTSFTKNAGGTTSIAANISTTNGAVTFGDNVTLSGDSVITSGTGAITFSGTINGAHNLSLASTGAITLSGIIGGTTPLTSFVTTSTGTTAVANNITTNGLAGISFGGNVTLSTNNVVLDSSAGNGPISFTGTISGAHALTLAAGTGAITFGGAVGTPTGLTGLTMNSASLVNIGNNITLTNSALSISAPISLTGNSIISSGTGAITLASTVNGAHNLTLNSTGATTLGGIIGGTTPLTALVTNASGTTSIAANISTTNGAVTFGDNVTLSGDSVITSGTGAITFNGTINGAHNLSLASTGAITLSGIIGGTTPLTSFVTTSTGTTAVANNITTNGLAGISFGGNVTLSTNNVVLDSSAGNGPISFTGTISGAHALTLAAGTGAITFGGAVGTPTGLTGLTINSASLVNICNNITLTNSALSISAPINLTGNSTISSGTGAITLASTVNGAHNLTLNSTGVTTLGGIIGGTTPLTALVTNAGGTTSIAANISTTNGAVTFGDNVTLSGDSVITSGTSAITFSGTIDGAHNLSLASTGAITLSGIIGGATPLTSFVTTSTGTIAVTNNITTNGIGGISFGGNFTLSTNNVVLDSSAGNGPISFAGTISGAHALTLAAGTDAITFSGAVGTPTALTGLTINSASLVNIGNNITLANAPLSIPSPVILTADSIISTGTGSNISFNGILNGNHNLSLDSGTSDILFATLVGGAIPLQTLTITNAKNVTALSSVHLASYNQLSGTGTANFGGSGNLFATGAVTINSTQIQGNIIGGTTLLNGHQSNCFVNVASLELNGTLGGAVVGTVNGLGGIDAAILTKLGPGHQGIFTMNGYVLPVVIPPTPTPNIPATTFSVIPNFAILALKVPPGVIFPSFIYTNGFYQQFLNPAIPSSIIEKSKAQLIDI